MTPETGKYIVLDQYGRIVWVGSAPSALVAARSAHAAPFTPAHAPDSPEVMVAVVFADTRSSPTDSTRFALGHLPVARYSFHK